jgi:membrane protein DedA with SNARE-associated domain
MNARLVFAGVCLLLASSGLFAASGAPQGIPLVVAVAAAAGAAAAVARFGIGRRTT